MLQYSGRLVFCRCEHLAFVVQTLWIDLASVRTIRLSRSNGYCRLHNLPSLPCRIQRPNFGLVELRDDKEDGGTKPDHSHLQDNCNPSHIPNTLRNTELRVDECGIRRDGREHSSSNHSFSHNFASILNRDRLRYVGRERVFVAT